MSNNSNNLLGYLRVMVAAWRDDPRGDAELLGRFAENRDEPAFAALVGRHGPLVWQTCRRLLGDTPDAEDAFQATFLALARKAGTFPVDSLAGWLHRVAWQAALNSRSSARRREGLERQLRAAASPIDGGDAGRDEIYAVLDEELAGLPERLRVPLVLRYLEGNTLEQVARVLGCSRRAVGKRLVRGEAILRERLARRGLTVAGGTVAALFAASDGVAAVPPRLINSTARAVVAFQAGSLTGGVADGARAVLRCLPEGVLSRKEWWLVMACVCTLGASVAVWQSPAGRSDAAEPPVASEAGRPGDAAGGEPAAGTDCFGDPLPAGAVARMGTVRWRHVTGPAVFTADGKSFFTSGLLWDTATGKTIRHFRDEKGLQPRSVVLSPDGRTFAALTGTGSASLWEVATGRQLRQWGTAVTAVTLADAGKTVVTAGRDGYVRFWEASTGKELRASNLGAAAELFSRDGRVAVSVLDRKKAPPQKNVLQLWDVATATELCRLTRDEWWDLRKGTAFSPDGKILATTSGMLAPGRGGKVEDGSVCLWDVATGKALRRTEPDPAGTWSLAFSADGKLLATGSGFGSVRLWDAATCKPAGSCKGYRSNISSLAFSPDGGTLASLSELHENIVRLWEVPSGREKTPPTEGHTGSILSVAFSPDDKTIITGGRDGTVRLWDADSGRERRAALRGGEFQAVAARSADGKTLVTIGSDFVPAQGKGAYAAAMDSPATVRVWDADSGRERSHFEAPGGVVQYAALSPDDRTLATVTRGGLVLWDVETGKEIRRLGPQPTCVAFSPDGKILAAESLIAAHSLWDVHTGERICDLAGGKKAVGSGGLVFSPDGRTLAVCENDGGKLAIRLWRLQPDGTRATSVVFPAKHYLAIWAMAFSPDGQTLASAGVDGTVRLWETATGGERRHFTGHDAAAGSVSFAMHDDAAWALSFAGDGRRLAAGNSDTTVLVWDVTGRLFDGHRLRPARLSAAEVQGLWADLAGTDAARADRAIWTLAAAPEQAAAFLRENLHPVPRAEAVKDRVDRAIADLDSDTFAVRRDAADELERLGEAAESALRTIAAKATSAEVRNRAGQLLEIIRGVQTSPSGAMLRSLRALQVLGQCNTPAARQLLGELAEGEPGARLTQEAKFAVKTLRPLPDTARH